MPGHDQADCQKKNLQNLFHYRVECISENALKRDSTLFYCSNDAAQPSLG